MDVSTFRNIELFAWIFTTFILVFVFGYVLVFIGFLVCLRYFYIKYKHFKLEDMKIDPRGKTVVVTGCDTGFGFSLALHLYDIGFNVFATCLNPEAEGPQTLKDVPPKRSSHLTVVHLDITSDDQVQEVLSRVKKSCGQTGLWGLVNNAGQNFLGDAELTTMKQYLRLSDINAYGMVRMCKAFLPLLRQAQGRIVNVTSVKGLISLPVNAPYTMTKYAGEAFSEVLRQEMAAYGVKVIVMEPGSYGGSTGCLNAEGMERIEKQLNNQWKVASDEVKQFYSTVHMKKHLEDAEKSARETKMNINPVIRAFEDALRSACPEVRYLVDGTKGLLDITPALARLSPYLPQRIFDIVRAYFFPYEIYH